MRLHDEHHTLTEIGKTMAKSLAKPLSLLAVNSRTEDAARLLEAYWCILLGKGAGTRWSLSAETKAIRPLINTSSPIAFDVGANTGEWALLFSQFFPQARIFLFEPQPACQHIIREKRIPNSELIPKAVSSANHSMKFYTTGDISGDSSLHQRRDSYFQNRNYFGMDVEATTIDNVVSSYSLARVDFMKMDIEGHELEALKGAARSLDSGIIRALSFEFGSANINSRTFFHDFWDLLHPLGYKIYRVLPSSRLMHIKEYYEDCEYFRSVTNYIAVLQ